MKIALTKMFVTLGLIILSCSCGQNGEISNNNGSRAPNESHDLASLPVARISFKGTGEYCTGILIEKNIVLTAAHCFYDEHTRLKSYTPDKVVIKEKDQKMSAPYDVDTAGEADYNTYDYKDIAWIRLKSNVDNATPVTIGVRKVMTDELPIGTELSAFGFTSGLWVNRKIIALDAAFGGNFNELKQWEIATELDPKMAGGDSGGPLFIKSDKKWFLVGVLQGQKGYSKGIETGFSAIQPFLPNITAALGGIAPATEEIK